MGRPAIDWTNKKISYLTVLKRSQNKSADGHVKWICQCECGNITEINSNVLGRAYKKNQIISCGCYKKSKLSEMSKQNYRDIKEQKFGLLTAKEIVGTTGKSKLWKCECDCGNKNFITTAHHLTSGNTQSCGCLKNSIGEYQIKQVLMKNNIKFQSEKRYPDLSNGLSRYDFYLPDYNRLIEFDGEQHYKATGIGWNTNEQLIKTQRRDEIKNKYAKEHNISLVRIPYWELNNITLEMIMGDQYLLK